MVRDRAEEAAKEEVEAEEDKEEAHQVSVLVQIRTVSTPPRINLGNRVPPSSVLNVVHHSSGGRDNRD